MQLRDYQREAVAAVEAELASGTRRPAVVLPTGAGKTRTFAELVRRYRETVPGRRVLVLQHRAELTRQNETAVRAANPYPARVGVVEAHRNQTLADIVVASVPTLASARRRRQLRGVGLIVVDECHHATARSYLDILEDLGALRDDPWTPECDGAAAVGVTATLTRGDGRALGRVWQTVAYSRDISAMIREGWLVRPHAERVRVAGLHLERVRRSGGDFTASALGQAMADADAPAAIARAVCERATGRATLAFLPTVATAELTAQALREGGLRAAVVSGAMPRTERRRVLEDFARGDIDVICNCMVLTEGTDLPRTSCIVVGRPTTSVGLYVQMVGRGLRLHPGKSDCLVLDVVGVTERHALATPVTLTGEEEGQQAAEPCPCQPGQMADGATCPCGARVCSDRCGCGGGRLCGCARGATEVAEGDLMSDLAAAAEQEGPGEVGGELHVEQVDLFGAAPMTWARTEAGAWFLTAGRRYLVLLRGERPGHWGVVECDRYRHGASRWVAQDVPGQARAMEVAQGQVSSMEHLGVLARAGQRPEPTEQARRHAASLGIDVSGMTAGQVREVVAVREASLRIDPYLSRLPAYT